MNLEFWNKDIPLLTQSDLNNCLENKYFTPFYFTKSAIYISLNKKYHITNY